MKSDTESRKGRVLSQETSVQPPNGAATQEDAVATRRRSGPLVPRWMMRLILAVVFIGGWELASGRLVEDYFISSPSRIAVRFWELLVDGTLLDNVGVTVIAVVIGFIVGAIAALLLGYALGSSPYWASVVEPFITTFWSIPRVALIPLLVIWVGIGTQLAITISAILTFFLVFFNTYYGIREVSQGLIDVVRIMGGTRRDVAVRVRIPSAFVWIAAGIKLSLPMALVGTVTAEMLASNRGLGFLVKFYGNSFDTTSTFAVLLALLIVGFLLDRLANSVSKRALVWKST
ncbi:ABC transporter permease [Ornithinimicrobium cryptoxanthini]|uniref:ABC transporter permease n=1 Tax=Ornithinimicrobium cryptoxanthini TaxID=2934161 RepID=A0ABY4YLZ9_9MICO|nr:ABC transporter permease [Ornithinimicrobium cryptoxanthini]USQ77816.1 ABC transporter permease [Ornithinimicrobium cryptoxanthini]